MNGKIRRPWSLRGGVGGGESGAEPARPRPITPPAPRSSIQSSASCRRCLWCLWHSAGHGLLRPTATVSGPDRPGLSGLPDSPLRGLLATTDAGTRVARNTTYYVFYVLFQPGFVKFSPNTDQMYVRWTKTFKRNCVVQNQPVLLFLAKMSFSLLLNLTNVETKPSKEIRYSKVPVIKNDCSILICKRLVLYVVRKYLIYYLNSRHHSSLFQIRFSQILRKTQI